MAAPLSAAPSLRVLTRRSSPLPHILRASYSLSTTTTTASLPLQIPSIPRTLNIPVPYLPAPLQKLGGLLSALWEGVLRAAPKKKPSKSQSKKRRNHGGKAAKDTPNIVSCSSCGRPKRAHVLCPYCVQNIIDVRAGDSNLPDIRRRMKEEIGQMTGTSNKEQSDQEGRAEQLRRALSETHPARIWRT